MLQINSTVLQKYRFAFQIKSNFKQVIYTNHVLMKSCSKYNARLGYISEMIFGIVI